ncbi:MAG: response regulator [Phycisphaerae bacterium]|nr:response regulator [Phycisphaerae bacterium]
MSPRNGYDTAGPSELGLITTVKDKQNGGQLPRQLTSILRSPQRLAALRATKLIDSPPEERFDRLARLAREAIKVPIVLLSLVDDHSQFFKSCVGLDGWAGTERRTSLDFSFCKHTVASGEPLIIRDARTDPLVAGNRAVSELGVMAYAGIPLVLGDDQVLGAFCVIDHEPRDWSEHEIALLKDLAESVMSEIRLEQAKEAAEAANRAKDRFLAVLSHELRMPISPSLMIVQEMASDAELPQHIRDDAAVVKRNIEQQVRLIDDLLDLTRIENGKLDIRLGRVDLRKIVQRSVDHFRADAAAKQIHLSFTPLDEPAYVHGDEARLVQVFGNLLKNAIKFTPTGGSISLTIDRTDRQTARIAVRDSGIGVSAEVLPHLFDAFAQGPKSQVAGFGGLGLGLAISKGILEEHGGTIEASSDGENKGTTFAVTLPLVSADRQYGDPVHTPAIASNGSSAERWNGKILLVDDHVDTLHAMSRLLRKLQHDVVTAESVADALRVAAAENPALLISDVGLPDGSGLDLMRELRQRQVIRGIALTGYGSESDYRQTLEAGFSAHLTKPIDFDALLGAIQTVSTRPLE